ncbi:MAG: ABC transporter substrate-binding protein [Coriobacteriia bacterium]|nr:ABC transporter substrate-binding protein [Coriobacteriia bacterium]
MSESSKLNLTRRSFILGGAAGLVGAGATAALSGCNRKKGGEGGGSAELTGAIAYTATDINPIANTTVLGRSVFWHISEGLYNIDFHTFKTYNGLAALSPTKVNDYTYDVILRDNAKFSNGAPVTTDDVIKSFKDNMKDEIFGSLLGFIKDVTAKDSKTVTFTLNYPFENLLEKRLAIVFIYPASMSKDELKSKPIGSGPWTLKTFDGNNGGRIEFGKNEYYEGKYAAPTDSMVWDCLLDNTSRTTAITDRTTLAMESVPDLNTGQITSSGATVDYVQGFSTCYFMFNCLKPPFNDVRVRQAINYAINVQSLIDVQLDGHATPATSFLPKSHPNYHKASTVYDYDPEKAKQLLAEAGQSNLNCVLTINNFWPKNLAPQIQSDLKAVGVNAELDVKTVQWNTLAESNSILPYDFMLTPGDPSQICDDVDLLMSFWYGDNAWMNGRSCWKKSAPEKWNELSNLMQRARESSSASTQQTLWNQCFDIIAENCPLLPFLHRELGTAYLGDKLSNFKPIATPGLSFLGASASE